MAKIPDIMSLGPRPLPEVNRQVVTDRSGLVVADALGELGQAVGRVGAELQDREDKFNYAVAKSTLLQADIEARRMLEDDPDWSTYETRYREAMGKAREKATGLVRGKRDRAMFDMETKFDVERGASAIRGIAKGKEIKWGRATLEEQLAGVRESALLANDQATRAALVRSSQEMIDGAIQKGYVDPEEAGTVRRNWTAAYGEGVVAMLSAEEQVAMLSKPKDTPADFIDPAKRALLLERAKKDIEIEDRARKQEARAARAEADANRERAQRNAADEAWKVIAAGGTAASIPRAIWRSMDGRDQMAVLNDEKNRIDGGKTATDWDRYYELKQLAADDPEAFRALPLTQDFDKLGPSERKELINLQQSAPNSVENLDAIGLSAQVDLATVDWKDKEEKGLFERRVTEKVYAKNRELGRKLNQDERQQIVDDLLIEGEIRDGGLWNSSKRRFELDPEEAERFVPADIADEFDAIPEDEKVQIKRALATRRLPQTPENVLQLYRMAQP